MPNYQNGKIYSIRSHLTDDVYIGSTIETLSNRLSQHKKYYKQWLITKKLYTTSFKIIEKDPENCYIELVELYPCNSKIELCRREGEIIRDTTCVNKNIAGRTLKEYYEDNKQQLTDYYKEYYNNHKEEILEKKKQYSQNNKEKIAEYKKQYRQTNKQSIIESSKQYYENNKEQIIDKHKQYRENNKEQLNEKYKQYYENNKEKKKQYREIHKAEISEKYKQKYTCECGSTPTIYKKSQHNKTKKHQNFINSN